MSVMENDDMTIGCLKESRCKDRLLSFFYNHFYAVSLLVMIPAFQPGSIDYLPMASALDLVYKSLKVVAILLMPFLLWCGRGCQRFMMSLGTLIAVLLLSSVMSGQGVDRIVSNWLVCFSAVSLARLSFSLKKSKDFGRILLLITGTISFLNLVSIVMFPEGLYVTERSGDGDCFFWGHRNTFYQIAFLSVAVSQFLDSSSREGLSLRTVMLFVLGLLQTVLAFSMTSAMALLCMLLTYLLLVKTRFSRLINGTSLSIVSVVFFLLVVVFRMQEIAAPVFSAFGKDATLTGRTCIWDEAFRMLTGCHILIGYGASDRLIEVAGNWMSPFSHAHNELLNILVTSGVLGVVFYAVMLRETFSSIGKMGNVTTRNVMLSLLSAFVVVGFTEKVTSTALFLILVMCIGGCCAGETRHSEEELGLEDADN